jgi:molybdopterin converting factor small subunit
MTSDVESENGNITLRLFGPLREIVGAKALSRPYAEMTPADALARFADEHGDSVRPMLFDSQGRRRRSLILLLNDQTLGEGEGVRLQGGDVLSVLLPLAGG